LIVGGAPGQRTGVFVQADGSVFLMAAQGATGWQIDTQALPTHEVGLDRATSVFTKVRDGVPLSGGLIHRVPPVFQW